MFQERNANTTGSRQLEKPMGKEGWAAALGLVPGTNPAVKLLPPAREQGQGSEAGDGVCGMGRCESRRVWVCRTGVRDTAVAVPLTCLMSPGLAGCEVTRAPGVS